MIRIRTGGALRIAIYGGSFNPPHVAHAMVAAWLLWTGRADEVWLVPVWRHAFEGRHSKTLAPFERRVAWCRALATDVDPRVKVCRVEADLPRPSYTIRTLRHLASRHPDHSFQLVLGADVLDQRAHWKDWDAIEREFDPLIVGRQGYREVPGAIAFPEVSSSTIRRRLAAGEPVDHLLTRSVCDAIGDYRWSEEP